MEASSKWKSRLNENSLRKHTRLKSAKWKLV